MKKILFSLIAVFSMTAVTLAENPDVLVIHLKNGKTSELKLEDIERLSFSKSETSIDPEPSDALDLSAQEMANCYIVQKPGTYKFKADNMFNLGEGLPVPPEIHPVDAKLVWQTEKDAIKSIDFIETESGIPYIIFEVSHAQGNALISALDDTGNIVWSWHIWMPQETVTSVKTSTGYEIMSMNLGAMNNNPGEVSSYGLLYQWGRKDPFPAAPTLTGDTSTVGAPLYDIDNNPVKISNSSWYNVSENTIDFAIANPTVCLSNYCQFSLSHDWLRSDLSDDSLWGNPDGDFRDSDTNSFPNTGRKTCYDPSPAGWRVAPADAFRNFTSSGGYAWTFDDFNVKDINGDGEISLEDYNYGWEFMVNENESLYFPAASRYDGQYAMLMGSMSGYWGNYWSNSPSSSINGGAFCNLSFQTKDQFGKEMITVSPSAGTSKADAFSIRCIRE